MSLVDDGGLTLAHYRKFFVDDFYLGVAARTLRLALLITAACTVIGFLLALLIHHCRGPLRAALLVMVILPLMTSVVVRTFGWLVILGPGGPLSLALQGLGLSDRPLSLMHSETGIVLAMVQVLLPFSVLSILASLKQIPDDLNAAARVMGAGFWRALWHVTLPLARPGLLAGALLVFALSISSFITPTLVGGVRLPVIAGSIYQQVIGSFDWGFAAALSLLLLTASVLLMLPSLAAKRPW